MKETMEMIQILERNKKEAQKRKQKEREIRIREQKKEQKKTGLLIALLIILLILSVGLLNKITKDDYNNCIKSGKSETMCSYLRSIDK